MRHRIPTVCTFPDAPAEGCLAESILHPSGEHLGRDGSLVQILTNPARDLQSLKTSQDTTLCKPLIEKPTTVQTQVKVSGAHHQASPWSACFPGERCERYGSTAHSKSPASCTSESVLQVSPSAWFCKALSSVTASLTLASV